MINEKRVFVALGIALIVYMAIRSFLVPIISDEAGTYFIYIQTADFVPYHAHWDANNHLINSALTVFFTKLFGNSIGVLRLANLIFLPVYLLYTYRISTILKDKYLRYGLIIVLWFAHFFVEFFGLCRGYGMSMALLVAALYYLVCFLQHKTGRYLLLTLLFNTLALTANLSLLNCFVLINAIAFLVCVLNFKHINKLLFGVYFVVFTIAPMLFFIKYLFELKKRNLLYYGSTKGFIEVTLKSVTNLIVGTNNMQVIGFVIAVFVAIILSYCYVKTRELKTLLPVDIFVAMLIGNVFIILILARLMHINYPEDRVGMYLFLFFAIAPFFIADKMEFKAKYLLVLPFIYFPVQFGFVANVTYSKLWYEDHIPERYFDNIIAAKYDTDGYPPIVSGYKMRTLVWEYFTQIRGAKQNQIQETDFRNNLLSDFIITRKKDVVGWEKYYNEIDFDPVSSLALLKRKQPPAEKELYDSSIVGFDKVTYEYINFCELKTDTLTGKNIKIKVEGNVKIYTDSFPNSRVVVGLFDKDDKDAGYYYSQLDCLFGREPNGEYKIKFSYLIPKIQANVEHIKVYYWNIEKQKISLTNGKIKAYLVN